MINIIGYPEARLALLFSEWDEKTYHVRQVLNWIYHHGAEDFSVMTNLSKSLRAKLTDYFFIGFPRIEKKTVSKDGTTKYLFCLEDDSRIESVWIPDTGRKTLCISTQVGCRLACTFCLTGTLGLRRNLTAAEFIGQYMAVNQVLPEEDRITNVVIMGMGEPLDNYEPVVDGLRLMVSPEAMAIGNRRITLSTSGLVDKLEKFQDEDIHVNLAVSLNATEDSTRDAIMPINKKYPIRVLLERLRQYPLKKRRRITFEYVLLKGVNDTPEDAVRLAKLLKGIPCKINLIAFNGFEGADHQSPSRANVLDFQNYLISKNYTVFIRKPRGDDVLGACGQLAAETLAVS